MIALEVRVGPWLQQLPAILARKPEFIADLMTHVGERGVQIMREEAPIRTGELRRSIFYETDEYIVFIRVGAPYARYVEFGTRPHIIEAPYGRRLKIPIDGFIFRKRVFHPGAIANPFVQRTRFRLVYDALDLTLRHLDVWLRL